MSWISKENVDKNIINIYLQRFFELHIQTCCLNVLVVCCQQISQIPRVVRDEP
jgi:hypothetical protein